ncbi:unnamed protein product [Microthlaspi erraticum]|uniref:DUF674 domain-containing protein n=1 Tax=Microthlaspi erraticum TaxID=1685480 RepID=A0A6D2LKB0_9BRAS|nr:unnamed protein product [Microthlaspi erraticum]
MDQSSGEPKLTLRLVVDEEKNKVVLAEADRDFVDVLFSLVTLPMGTIVRLLENHRKSESVTIGCFGNLYKSVVDMGVDDFETEACKQMLVRPGSLRDVQCKRLKLSINPTDDVKYFECSSLTSCKMLSDFSTSQCRCGKLMKEEVKLREKVEDKIQNGVFVRGRSSFIITDDLIVAIRSTDLILKKLKSAGCGDLSKVGERLIDIGFEEVMTLLQCIFSSNAPLTDALLKKQIPQGLKTCQTPSPYTVRESDESEQVITLSVIMSKHDMKVLYVECGEDFVDLVFTFLAVPLENVLQTSGNNSNFGCIGNLLKSFNDLRATQVSTSEAVIPHYYKCQKQLLNIITAKRQSLVRTSDSEPMVLIDPKSNGNDQSTTEESGFAKRDTKFIVSDDLVITPMNSSSTFCLLKKLQIQAEDLEVQEISISKTEATSLLRASLLTSSALNAALWSLIAKKPEKET